MVEDRLAPAHSPLWQLGSKTRLCRLLGLTRQELKSMGSREDYRVWDKREGRSSRTIEEPIGKLRKVHSDIQRMLSQLEVPEWVFSGIRGRSYVGNARFHSGHTHVLSSDIEHFYRSTRREYVFRFFRYRLCQSDDVAWAMTDLVTFDGHLPTGSPSSQLLAFWSYEPVFQQLQVLALSEGADFSLYVDDITMSSDSPLSPALVRSVRGALAEYDLRLKACKTRARGSHRWKLVTGAALTPDGVVRIPNKRRQDIRRGLEALRAGDCTTADLRRLQGLLCSARQIDPTAYEEQFGRVSRLLRERRQGAAP